VSSNLRPIRHPRAMKAKLLNDEYFDQRQALNVYSNSTPQGKFKVACSELDCTFKLGVVILSRSLACNLYPNLSVSSVLLTYAANGVNFNPLTTW